MSKFKPLILCVGSDRRQLYAAKKLSSLYEVYTFKTDGAAQGVTCLGDLNELSRPIDLLLLPMPCSSGLSIPCATDRISCSDIVPYLSKNAVIAGGKMCVAMIEYFNSLGFDTADYFRREELIVKNCVPTAEGALSIALCELDVTVRGTPVLILGWGRVAKACAMLFSAVGAKVGVCARKTSAVAEAESLGFEGFGFDELINKADEFRLVINSVPSRVITREVIEKTRPDCLMIDLASKPGGTDFAAAEALRRKAIHALSLPGKCAPVTAGEIIADAVINIYNERSGRNVT